MKTFAAIEYLKIDIANHFGLDKEDWDVRIAWFDAHENELEMLTSKAEVPQLFYAAVQAYYAVIRGEKIGYPIGLDATASGLQLLACLTRDAQTAKLCNVLDVGHRVDAYTELHKHIEDALGGSYKITRAQAKDAIMPAFYASQSRPKEIFGEHLPVFNAVMFEKAPLSWELNTALIELWDPTATCHEWVLPDNYHVAIKVMTDHKEEVSFMGQPLSVSYQINAPKKKGRSLCANLVHSIDGLVVREITRRAMMNKESLAELRKSIASVSYVESWPNNLMASSNTKLAIKLWNHYERSGYLSSRILEVLSPENVMYFDPKVLLELVDSIPEEQYEVLTVHDCFRVLPKYANTLRKEYAHQLAMITRSNLLEYTLGQILGMNVVLNKGSLDWTEVLNSEYPLS